MTLRKKKYIDMNTRKRLVFVDDEPNILKALNRVFFDDDYEIETFEKGEEALRFIKENDVQLVISDQRMPEMTGTELLSKINAVKPEIMRIILTGFADMDAAVDAINKGQIYQFIFKPWNDDELRAVVLRALENYDLQSENKRLLAELMIKNEQLNELNGQLGKKVKERTQLIVKKNLELGKLNKSLEGSLLNVIRVFMTLMETVRPEMNNHNRRVATMATEIAKNMGWSENKIRNIEISSLLHDIGKLAIPEGLLGKKPDHLTDGEEGTIRNHTVLGQNILASIESFNAIGLVIRHHHERWDGRGYPDGIKGKDIPEESRIIAACNVYDHIMQEQESRSPAFVRKYFENNAGSQFDPQVTRALLKMTQGENAKEEVETRARVLPNELKPGMVLAENLVTGRGIFLLPQGQLLKEAHMKSIKDIQKVDPIPGSVEVIIQR